MKNDTDNKEEKSDILSTIVLTNSPTQKKGKLATLDYYEESRMLLSELDGDENVLIIVFNILK